MAGWMHLLLALSAAMCATASIGAPAQVPLLNPPRPPVKPNLMITLDDSQSMGSLYLPEFMITIGTWRFASPAFGYSIGFDPGDTLSGNVLGSDGTFTADPASRYWEQRAMRSPDVNSLYYNPQVRYRPWMKSDGSRYPAADIARAVLDPSAAALGTVDLSQTVAAKSARWCTTVNAHPSQSCPVTEQTYAPGLYYRLKRENSGTGSYMNPQSVQSYDAFDANAADGVPRGADRSDCAAAQCTQAEEQQNFANWFVYYRSRLHVAKAVLGETLGGLRNAVRLGYGRLSKAAGPVDDLGDFRTIVSGVRDFDEARKAETLQWVYGLRFAGGTPMLRAMQDVGNYYQVADSRGPWGATPGTASTDSQASCRAAYHLMITDGYWSSLQARSVGNVDGTDGPAITLANGKTWQYIAQRPFKDDNTNFLSDVAMYYWNRDLRPDLPNEVPLRPGNEASWQSMSNYIVGLGVKGLLDPATDLPALTRGEKTWGEDRIDDLWHAALNSRGAYFDASNAQSLMQSLRRVFSAVVQVDRSQAGVALSAREQSVGRRRYQAVYRASDWSGDLRAYALDASGAQVWSAEKMLPPWRARRIFIRDEGQPSPTAVPFEWGRLSEPLRALLGAGDAEPLVNYLRGDRSREGEDTWRVRGGVLGDFINSTLLVTSVSAGSDLAQLPGVGASYEAYVRDVKASRTRTVFVGGNDGMLHAFRDAPDASGGLAGREMFAYIPRAVAGQLASLASADYLGDRHRYFVDGPLTESDVHVPPPGGGPATWRTYLFGSTGAGPAAVFALDVTNPSALDEASARWEIRGDANDRLGHVLAPVVTGRLPDGRWVALFGNGYGSADEKTHLFVADVATGAVQTVELPTESAATAGLGGVAVRKDEKGQVVAVYAGDRAGRLWRLDYSPTASASFTVAFAGKPLFRAEPGQPIVQPPLVQTKGARTFVAIGTGQLITQGDAADATTQAVYVVEDRPGETLAHPLTPAQLAQWVLSALTPDASATAGGTRFFSATRNVEAVVAQPRGWRIALGGAGVPARLRVLQPLQAIQEQFLVGAEAPPESTDGSKGDPCSDAFEGRGLNLLLNISMTPVSAQPVLDTNADGVINASDSPGAVGYAVAADGRDAISVPGPASESPAAPGGGAASPSAACPTSAHILGGGGSMIVCLRRTALGALRDRVWRRILQPPF